MIETPVSPDLPTKQRNSAEIWVLIFHNKHTSFKLEGVNVAQLAYVGCCSFGATTLRQERRTHDASYLPGNREVGLCLSGTLRASNLIAAVS